MENAKPFPTCKDCLYWDDSDWAVGGDKGDCHRYAPSGYVSGREAEMLLSMRAMGQSRPHDEEGIDATRARWSWTHSKDWCGEFRHREQGEQ